MLGEDGVYDNRGTNSTGAWMLWVVFGKGHRFYRRVVHVSSVSRPRYNNGVAPNGDVAMHRYSSKAMESEMLRAALSSGGLPDRLVAAVSESGGGIVGDEDLASDRIIKEARPGWKIYKGGPRAPCREWRARVRPCRLRHIIFGRCG